MTSPGGALSPAASSDEALVPRAGRGEEGALEELVRRHHPTALRFARRALDAGVAEEAAAEALVALLRAAPRFEAGRPFGPWWGAILANTVRHAARSERRRIRREAVAARRRPESTSSDPSAALVREEIEEHVRRLPADVRIPVVLHYLEGHSHEDVGALVGCPAKTAASRIRRGLEQLRVSLGAAAGSLVAAAALEAAVRAVGQSPAPLPGTLSAAPSAASVIARARSAGRRALAAKAAVLTLSLVGLGLVLTLGGSPRGGAASPDESARVPAAAGDHGHPSGLEHGTAPSGAASTPPPGESPHPASLPTTTGARDPSAPAAATRSPAPGGTAPVDSARPLVFGRVVDDRGNPFVQSELTVSWHRHPRFPEGSCGGGGASGWATTDHSGAWSVRLSGVIPAGAWLEVKGPPWLGIFRRVEVLADEAERLDLGPSVIAVRDHAWPLVVTVRSAAPVVSASVVVTDEETATSEVQVTATTGPDQTAHLVVPPTRTKALRVLVAGSGKTWRGHLSAPTRELAVDLDQAPESSLEGTVRDERGESLQAIRVTATPVGPTGPSSLTVSTVSGTDGRFRLAGLAPGLDYVVASQEDDERLLGAGSRLAQAPARGVDLTVARLGAVRIISDPGETTDALVTGDSGIRLPPGGTLLAETARSLRERREFVLREARRGERSAVYIGSLAPGRYRVFARPVVGDKKRVAGTTVTVVPGEVATVLLAFGAERTVRGRIVAGGGAPVEGASVVESGPGGLFFGPATTNERGEWTLTLSPDAKSLRVETEGHASLEIHVPSGASVLPDVVLGTPFARPGAGEPASRVAAPAPPPDTALAARASAEAAAVAGLKTITVCQTIFREGDKDQNGHLDYGTLDALARARLCDAELGSGLKGGYRFRVYVGTSNPEFVWCATATPVDPEGHSFFVNQAGVVFMRRGPIEDVDVTSCRIPEGLYPMAAAVEAPR